MEGQKVPDIEFDHFVIAEIPELFKNQKIAINSEYQRGDVWKTSQKKELIKSIVNTYSIGVLVLFMNDNGQYEILDGQQRLLTIKKYLENILDLSNTNIPKYSELSLKERTHLDSYCIYYLRLKSYHAKSKEEDIVQVFLRLQEGTPLNKAEKINAHRGRFKDVFRETRENHPIFEERYLGKEKRFRLRQLAAELLTLELESDFKNKIFPSLDLDYLLGLIKKYETSIPKKKLTFFTGNLDYLHRSLNYLLTGFKPGELISFYLLISYLRKTKADNKNLINEYAEFTRNFLVNLHCFSIYDNKPPANMPENIFREYRNYKLEAKKMTTADSIKNRFEIMLREYSRLHPLILKDHRRLYDTEQKRTLFFRQKGICGECKKPLNFNMSSGHHIFSHAKGGTTDDLYLAILLHEKCHRRLEKRLSNK